MQPTGHGGNGSVTSDLRSQKALWLSPHSPGSLALGKTSCRAVRPRPRGGEWRRPPPTASSWLAGLVSEALRSPPDDLSTPTHPLKRPPSQGHQLSHAPIAGPGSKVAVEGGEPSAVTWGEVTDAHCLKLLNWGQFVMQPEGTGTESTPSRERPAQREASWGHHGHPRRSQISVSRG